MLNIPTFNVQPILTEAEYQATLNRVHKILEGKITMKEKVEIKLLITEMVAYEEKHLLVTENK